MSDYETALPHSEHRKKWPQGICIVTAFSPRTLIMSNYHSIIWCSLPLMRHYDAVDSQWVEWSILTSLNTRLCSGATCRWSCYKTFTRPPWRRWRRPRTSACGSRPTPSWESCTLTAATTHACRGFSNSFISPVRWVGLVPPRYSTLGELRAGDSVSKRRKSVVVRPRVCGERVCVRCVHAQCVWEGGFVLCRYNMLGSHGQTVVSVNTCRVVSPVHVCVGKRAWGGGGGGGGYQGGWSHYGSLSWGDQGGWSHYCGLSWGGGGGGSVWLVSLEWSFVCVCWGGRGGGTRVVFHQGFHWLWK